MKPAAAGPLSQAPEANHPVPGPENEKRKEGIPVNGLAMTNEELTAAYETYGNMVYRIAYIRTKSHAQAEDIQHDVFLALVRFSERIRDEEHLKAWLIHVTKNACRKHFRSLWIRLTVFYDDNRYKKMDRDGESLDSPPLPFQEEEDEKIELVRDLVEKLPEGSRTLIHLFYYEKLSVREIARALALSEQNVKTRLSRARKKLKKLLEEADE